LSVMAERIPHCQAADCPILLILRGTGVWVQSTSPRHLTFQAVGAALRSWQDAAVFVLLHSNRPSVTASQAEADVICASFPSPRRCYPPN
jgi:hypothetical protein